MSHLSTYKVKRGSLKVGSEDREAGTLIPEAVAWRLSESLLRSGQIEHVAVSDEDHEAFLLEHNPQEAPAVYAYHGLPVPESIAAKLAEIDKERKAEERKAAARAKAKSRKSAEAAAAEADDEDDDGEGEPVPPVSF